MVSICHVISQDNVIKVSCDFKGALLGLKQSLATESFLKTMKNAFYLTSKTLFVLKIFKILS